MEQHMTIDDMHDELADIENEICKLELSIKWDDDERVGKYDLHVTVYDNTTAISYDTTYATYDTHADAVNAIYLIADNFTDYPL